MTDLFDWQSPPPPRARPRYQQTSRDAYQRIAPVSGELDRLIVRAIREAGPHGIICQGIEEKICRSHQAVSGNLRHLVERGVVKASGEHGKTSSGRRAMKWVLAT